MPEWKDALGGACYKRSIKVEQNCKLIMFPCQTPEIISYNNKMKFLITKSAYNTVTLKAT